MSEPVQPVRGGNVAPAIEQAARTPRLSIPLRDFWWAALVLLGVSAGAVAWTIWELRSDAFRAAIAESGNIAAVLASQLSRSIYGIDSVLIETKRATRDLDIDTPASFRYAFNRRSMHDALADKLGRLPQAFNVAIADRNGQLTVSTAAWPTPAINIADRDYFMDARDRSDAQISTSTPIYNRIDGKQTIVFARRLETATGEFAGIIYCSVNTEYFENIYGSIQSVHSHQFRLRKWDGTILASHPDSPTLASKTDNVGAEWHAAVVNSGGGYSTGSQSDGGTNFVSVRTVPDYPLVVDIMVTDRAALDGWRQRAATIGFGSAALLVCSIYLLLSVTRQVRRLSNSEASLGQKSRQLDAALNNMSQGLSMFDGQSRLIICNRQYNEIYKLTPEQTKPGTSIQDIVTSRVMAGQVPEDSADFIAKTSEQISLNRPTCVVHTLQDGRIVSTTHQPMRDGGWVAVHQDITAQKRAEAELAHMARYDSLTGLANRTLFMDRARAAIEKLRTHGSPFAILMLDLDRFKTVNDSLGHAVGDSLLKVVAQRLRNAIPNIETIARLGGDEFAILVSLPNGIKEIATSLADKILAVVTEPYDFESRRFTIETSVGITFAPQDGTNPDALLKNADLALYRAKSLGGNRYCLFEPAMEATARERRELEDDMRKAIARNEFELHYQTIVNAGKLDACGVEALVRWRHPERGLIPPDQFISLAEESGLIVPLGEWILRKACADAVQWPAHLKLAVNMSPAQFKQPGLPGVLKSILEQCALPASRLELEITETVLLDNNEEHVAVLHEIKNLGVSIVLDDFGIGYSSMRYLQMFPFDKIKIDKTFIQSMTSHPDSAAIVCAIAGLGRALDIETAAEGVETTEQLALLRSAGCQLAQGFLFSRPVPLSELTFDRSGSPRGAQAA
jgi:diguanylate cyclase (GGDEF)-like protein